MLSLTRSQIIISWILSIFLVVSLSPGIAYADFQETAHSSESPSHALSDEGDQKSNSEEIDEELAKNSEGDESLKSEESDQELSSGGGSGDTVIASENIEEDALDFTIKNPNDVLSYIYVDRQIVAQGNDQVIAVGLKDNGASVEEAKITLTRAGDEKTLTFDAYSLAENSMGFVISCNGEIETSNYEITAVEYRLGEQKDWFKADFTNLAQEERHSFDVVDAETADAMGSVRNSDTTAMVLNGNDEIEAYDSVDEAMAVASSSYEAVEKSDINTESRSVVESTKDNYLIVAINAGHGGSDSGAVGNGLLEKDLNLSIAQYMRDELNTYTGVSAYMVRDSDVYLGLQERVDKAKNVGADVFVSLHINSGGGTGSEVWVPNDATYNYETHTVGMQLGGHIAQQLKALGLTLRTDNPDGVEGVKVKDSSTSEYPDGSTADYYSDIRNSRLAGFPGIIVEHAFIDRASDASKLAQDSFRKQLGQADATGLAQCYGLGRAADAQAVSLVSVKSHVAHLGWENEVYDGKVSGTTGKGFGLEAIQINLQNEALKSGGVRYSVNVDGAWQNWVSDGATAGSTGTGQALQAVKVELTGEAASKYDIYYRIHSAKVDWLGWAKNGESAGSTGYDYDAQAIELVVVPKGSSAPGSTDNAFMEKETKTSVSYSTHVQTYGWQNSVFDGAISGTTGEAKRLEGIKVNLTNPEYSGSVQYRTHIQTYGWEDGWKTDGVMSGTSGEAKRLEAIQIQLTGDVANHYDVYYRVHAQQFGWMGWAKNGESAGTQGYAYRLEAIEIQLVPKGSSAPGSTDNAFMEKQNTCTPIMGSSLTTVNQMVNYYNSTGHKYPSGVYASKGASSIDEFCQIVYEEARVEGVRAEVLFCQAMKETGWLQFGGSVKAEQCNFGGLGAVSSSASGASFGNVREGLRAQVQHLKAYASVLPLVNECVDPRFNLVTRGIAPNLEDLNGRWAVPGNNYGQEIRQMMDQMLSI